MERIIVLKDGSEVKLNIMDVYHQRYSAEELKDKVYREKLRLQLFKYQNEKFHFLSTLQTQFLDALLNIPIHDDPFLSFHLLKYGHILRHSVQYIEK